MRTLVAALAVSVGIGGALVACGGDDQFVQPGGNTDGGLNPDGTTGDGGKGGDAGDGGPNSGDGGGDSGEGGSSAANCPFTAFVIDQITTGTKENTSPVPNAMIPDAACSLNGNLTQDYATIPGFH